MFEIAIYGKGGIGKSTMAANISASLANENLRVLQIGCDPKHDSTRLLMDGVNIRTVLDYIRVTGPADYQINDILFHGYKNIGCVEAGGPEPGVGCAGRGIITTFELLDQFRIKDNYDITVYDVLGDVVCGGFAVPIRKEYADAIFIVTSGEYMALYAANNILRGIKNYDGKDHRVAGIIYNKRNIDGEDERLRLFSDAVDLPICATIPRSDAFAYADQNNKTVVENSSDHTLTNIFADLAKSINKNMKLYEAKPLEDSELEHIIFNKKIINEEKKVDAVVVETNHKAKPLIDLKNSDILLSKNMTFNEPLHGCAFNGAISMAVHLQDVVIIAHSPKSCTYLSYQSISSAGRRGLFERGALLPVSIAPNFTSSNMNEADIIFGGIESLTNKIIELKKNKPKAMVVISSCPSGIIGDDIDKIKYLQEKDMPIYTIKTDGNLAGDYLQGMLMTYTTLAKSIIKKNVDIIPNTVNIIFEKVVAKNTNSNFQVIEQLLSLIDVKVNCRFLCETTLDKLQNFMSAPLNLLAFKDYTGEILTDFFKKEYDAKFLNVAFPIGFDNTKEWLYEVANYFGKSANVAQIISDNEIEYYNEIGRLKPKLKGKKLMIITYNHELDWILKTALDLEMDIVKICILNFSQDTGFRTNLAYEFNVEENYDGENREQDILKFQPDILLSNYAPADKSNVEIIDTIPMCPDVGFYSGLIMAQRWEALLNLNVQGEWQQDEQLFTKYYGR